MANDSTRFVFIMCLFGLTAHQHIQDIVLEQDRYGQRAVLTVVDLL